MHFAGWTALLMACATALAACHTTRVVWSKPGGDATALQSDLRDCASPTHTPSVSPLSSQEALATTDMHDTQPQQMRCMIDRGWRLTPVP